MLNEVRIYERFEKEVNIPYYKDYADSKICLDAAIDILTYREENDIQIDNNVLCKMLSNTSQIAIECKELDVAEKLINNAKEYIETDWEFVTLLWRESQLNYNLNKKEESYNDYMLLISEYERLMIIDEQFMSTKAKNNLCAIKGEVGSFFNSSEYIYESMIECIYLYNEKVYPLQVVKDTYKTFKRVVNDITKLNYIKNLLTMNKITL